MAPQHILNDFLQAELHHSMGAYGLASTELEALQSRIKKMKEDSPSPIDDKDVTDTLDTNVQLRDASWHEGSVEDGRRHPPSGRDYPHYGEQGHRLGRAIAEFYDMAGEALAATVGDPLFEDETCQLAEASFVADELDEEELFKKLGLRLGVTQDAQRRGRFDRPGNKNGDEEAEQRARRCKLERMGSRRGRVEESLLPPPRATRLSAAACARYVLSDHLGHDSRDGGGTKDEPTLLDAPVHQTVIAALVDGHLRMHQAEHELSGTFEESFTGVGVLNDRVKTDLRISESLHTFAYAAARSMPWIFAEDAVERDHVIAYYRYSCDAFKPTYCIWVAHQVSMLALHRRGFCHWLARDGVTAYRDFFKLKRLIRQADRVFQRSVSNPPGGQEFLNGLYALAEHHTGRIYQAEHAHDVALRHFKHATARLERIDDGRRSPMSTKEARARELLHNSRWRIRLLIGQGRAYYELGRIKRSLLSYAEAWRCFLQLSDTEYKAESNLAVIDSVIGWLRLVVDDPDIDKAQLRDRMRPLVEQFQTVSNSGRLRWVAADIMMRIGHALVVLKLPGEGALANDPQPNDLLAYSCLTHAAALDNRSTVVGSDLLRIEHRAGPERVTEYREQLGSAWGPRELPAIRDQWPGGGSQFEEAARVVEYLLQWWLSESDARDGGSWERDIAGALLPAFLTHTDSTNVRLAQVYRYLMQEPAESPDLEDGKPIIEMVCARRYSSFFPFLPRPSAFRVRGGGYFVRITDDGLVGEAERLKIPDAGSKRSFGIVIDPGPDFLDNLYRCGYGMGDIDMVIVTHDDADHVASLDALLALLGYREGLVGEGEKRFRPRGDRCGDGAVLLPIVGNESVVERYAFFNERTRGDSVCVLSFQEFVDRETPPEHLGDDLERILLPPSMQMTAVTSVRHRDARRNLAVGCVIKVTSGSQTASIGFTSDTGWSEDGEWPGDADVVVAHISGVPLRDLRELAGLDVPPPGTKVEEQVESFQALWDDTAQNDKAKAVLRRLQFGFRSRSNDVGELDVSPLSHPAQIRKARNKHLYFTGLLKLAKRMRERGRGLLVIGELREELGTFRTRIAAELNSTLFAPETGTRTCSALTADIGLKVKVRPGKKVEVLCSTCDLDNDLLISERFHDPARIHEVCVKGEQEGVFYNCGHHNPQSQSEPMFVELVERYDVFGR